jgi:uncharacterized membrane protein YjjP (DUF1212 family)
MNKMPVQNEPTTKYPKWLYFVGAAVLLCFALAFVPGGQAMPIIGVWIAGWAFTIWLFSKYRWVRIAVTIAFILIAFGAYLIISAGQAGKTFYGN